jgi:hypothetical protein
MNGETSTLGDVGEPLLDVYGETDRSVDMDMSLVELSDSEHSWFTSEIH